VPFISLVNLLAGRAVVPELLQGDMTPERIAAEVERLLSDPKPTTSCWRGCARCGGGWGPRRAAARAAEAVLELLPSD